MDKQEVLHKMSIIVTYKQPFNDWVNSLKPQKLAKDDFRNLYSTYLISDVSRAYKTIIRRYYNRIFRNELSQFCHNHKYWPEDINYTLFNEWFSVSVADWVYDINNRKSDLEYDMNEYDLFGIDLGTTHARYEYNTLVGVQQKRDEP